MKLRNKKTGEIGELHYYPDKAHHFAVSAKDPTQTGIYKTLGELLQDWTDFIVHVPAEPLIKDSKIRKAVRAWAEINDICGAEYGQNAGASWFVFKDYKGREMTNIGFLNRWALSKSENGKAHTITELCGEEE